MDDDPAVRCGSNGRSRTVCLDDVIAKRDATAEPEPEEERAPVKTAEEAHWRTVSELVKALAAANRHVENLVAPAQAMREQLSTENDKLRARITELEGQVRDMHAAHERILSEEHERQRQTERDRREQARRDKALEAFTAFLPGALAGVAGHFGYAPMQEAILVEMVKEMSDEQLRTLIASGFAGPKAIAVLERIRAQKKANGPTSQTPNGTPPPNGHPNSTEPRVA